MLLSVLIFVIGCVPFFQRGGHVELEDEDLQDKSVVILISIDGYRADYLDLYPTPNLTTLVQNGVRAEGLIAAHPTKTFPNHYSIVTGLYPSNHGIVANTMYDAEYDKIFKLSDRAEVENPRWWGGEPLWVTAELQGVRSATYFWPGSEAPIKGKRPMFWKRYDGSIPGNERVDEVLSWMDLPAQTRPRFVTLYFSDVDSQGHEHGPNSPQLVEAIHQVDGYLGRLIKGLADRGLTESTNLVVVSDHGMVAAEDEKLIFLDDYVDMKGVNVLESTPVLMLKEQGVRTTQLFDQLRNVHPALRVYSEEEYPAHWHWTGHRRIPKMVAVADEGWTIVESRAAYEAGNIEIIKGVHGYERNLTSMHALFVASGPDFKTGILVDAFENVHIYPLLSHVLGLKPAESDGSLESVKHLLRQ